MFKRASVGVFIIAIAAGCSSGLPESDETLSNPETLVESANGPQPEHSFGGGVDAKLNAVLRYFKFGGRVQEDLEARLGHELDPGLADLGRLLWFDKSGGLHSDNTCGGCHAPSAGFGDTQSIAIGVQSNNLVGSHRKGPRNQRRTPMVLNTAFYPKLMWNGRFAAMSGDPFDNSQGFTFPAPEGSAKFPPNDPMVTHLLVAQAHIPPTELVEVAGFTGTKGTIGPEFDQFDDGLGSPVPGPDDSGFRNDPIRQAVLARLNATAKYRELFGKFFPEVAAGGPIEFGMFAHAITEFECTLTFANAPIDRFARGNTRAMSAEQKRGALLFFGKANCVGCHSVSGKSNEMFSDFENHVIAVPQIAPKFGVGAGNMIFDGPGKDEDFGAEQISGDPNDRYKFRTSPLRNVALQPAFFHNGAFTDLRDAIVHHLNVAKSARRYNPRAAGVDADLTHRLGPVEPMLERVDPYVAKPTYLSRDEVDDLLAFVRDGLLDPAAKKAKLCKLIPSSVPSGESLLQFEDCPAPSR